MRIDRRSFIKTAAAGGAMTAAGDMFAACAVSGRVSGDGRPLGGVVVSDGLNCAETNEDGTWSLPENGKARFISITVPSGWRIARHYLKYEGTGKRYDFSLSPWSASKSGAFSFVHIGDSEINPRRLEAERRWIARARDLAASSGAAFMVHTGDIDGQRIPLHAELMNERTVGCPVYYVVGNHDIKGREKGEAIFEGALGPCWYSFDAGGTHFVSTPMMWGDGRPSYDVEDIVGWLRNDLAIAARKKQPFVILTHGGVDSRLWDLRRFFADSSVTTESAEPFEATKLCRLTAVVHGHIHSNYFHRSDDGKIALVSAAAPNKNDATLQVVRVGADGHFACAENVYDLEDEWRPSDAAPKGGWLAKLRCGNVYRSQPAVADGAVYVGAVDYSGAENAGMYAFDAETGVEKWFFRTRGDVVSSAVCIGGRVFVHDSFWQVYALDSKTGRQIWRFDAREEIGLAGSRLWGGASGFSASFMTYDAKRNRLYVGTACKSLFALDPDSAKVVWRTDATHGLFIGSPTHAALCGDVVVGRANWAGTFAYDAGRGKTLWMRKLGDAPTAKERHRLAVPWLYCHGYPVFRGGKLILTGHDRYFECDPATGEMLRQKELGFGVSCFTSPVFLDGRIYFGSERDGLVCLDEKSLEILWKAPVEPALYSVPGYGYSPVRSLCSVPVAWKGLVWATAQDGALYAWDPVSGERRERIFTGVPYIASAKVSDNRLYTADFSGRVRCFV